MGGSEDGRVVLWKKVCSARGGVRVRMKKRGVGRDARGRANEPRLAGSLPRGSQSPSAFRTLPRAILLRTQAPRFGVHNKERARRGATAAKDRAAPPKRARPPLLGPLVSPLLNRPHASTPTSSPSLSLTMVTLLKTRPIGLPVVVGASSPGLSGQVGAREWPAVSAGSAPARRGGESDTGGGAGG